MYEEVNSCNTCGCHWGFITYWMRSIIFCRRSVSILLFSHNVYVSFAQLGFETGNVVPVVFGGCVLKWISHPVRIVFAAGKDVVGQRVDALRFVAEAGKDI